MALSNRDRVGRGFELLAGALDEFLTKAVQVDEHSTWIDLLELTDSQRGWNKDPNSEGYSRTDTQCSLRFITEGTTSRYRSGWYPLRAHLKRSDEALASELRDTRNNWAHNSPFSTDDTYRALDTMARLAQAINNKPVADALIKQKEAIRGIQLRQNIEKESTQLISVGGENLPAWRDVIAPHPDVAKGSFNPSGFAADLYTVANPAAIRDPEKVSASAEYTDPHRFFERTYITEGLRDLLPKALKRLSGDPLASPVINLQTNFGGGKTHSMLAVWHLFGGLDKTHLPQDLHEVIGANDIPAGVRRVALVGTSLSASGKMLMPDGTVVHTIWGHLAWQLGNYELIREDDENGTNPGAKLRLLLEKSGPALILIDEWVAYARQLVGTTKAGGSLSTQQSFAQALSEAVADTPGSMLLVSIPASAEMTPGTYVDDQVDAEEIGGADGQEALLALLQVINRKAEQWRPAGATESFEIVRRRIFAEIPDSSQSKISAIAEAMRIFYQKTPERFPIDAARSDYKTKIERCYPIHPELFDRLYEDWASLPKFQRTRGVLRLMSIIVHQVWTSADSSPFIMPASIPLKNPQVANELAQYLDDDWKSVMAVDVDGPVPNGIDEENSLLGARHVTTRLARTVFLGSAARGKNSGIEERFINLGTALPGDKLGNFPSALNALANKSSHFYTSESRYWFDTSANITSEVRQREEALSLDNLHEEIEKRLEVLARNWSRGKSSLPVIPAPRSNNDIPDYEDTRLVILAPSVVDPEQDAAQIISQSKENQARTHKNTLVFLAADPRRLSELVDSVRKFLAWSSVRDDATALDLTASQFSQAQENTDKWSTTINDRLADSYQQLLIPEEPSAEERAKQIYVHISVQKITGGQDIIGRAAEKLFALDKLKEVQAAKVLVLHIKKFLKTPWNDQGYVELGQLWGMHTKYLYMPRLMNRSVLEKGILQAHMQDMLDEDYPFALADGVEGDSFINLRWPTTLNLSASTLPDSLLLVNPVIAEKQFKIEKDNAGSDGNSEGEGTTGGTSGGDDNKGSGDGKDNKGGGNGGGPGDDDPDPITTYYGTFPIPAEAPLPTLMRIDDEIIHHYRELQKAGAEVTLTLDIKAVHLGGIPESVQKMTTDSTQELKGSSADFE